RARLLPASLPRLRPRGPALRDAGMSRHRQAHRAERPLHVLLPDVPEMRRVASFPIAAVLLAAALAAPARADGVLAIGVTSPIVQGGLTYGYVRNFSPRASAQAAAVDTCRRLANVPQAAENCRVVAQFTDQCFAIAFVPQAATGLAWAVNSDRQEAERKALNDRPA